MAEGLDSAGEENRGSLKSTGLFCSQVDKLGRPWTLHRFLFWLCLLPDMWSSLSLHQFPYLTFQLWYFSALEFLLESSLYFLSFYSQSFFFFVFLRHFSCLFMISSGSSSIHLCAPMSLGNNLKIILRENMITHVKHLE